MSAASDSTETELTLRLKPGSASRLVRSAKIKALQAGPLRTQRLRSTYYDTSDFVLRRAQMALRVRRIGDRFVQTIKAAPQGDAGPAVRGEWERPLRSERPDIAAIDDRGLRKVFDSDGLSARLKPMFTTDIRRSVIPLAFDGSEIELAVDVGEIRGPAGAVPVCEAEIELKSGTLRAIYDVAEALSQSVPVAIETQSKSDRGYALIENAAVKPRRAVRVPIARDATVGAAFTAIARGCIIQLRANAGAVHSGDHPEGMHQLRVAIRRLRSGFSVFADALPSGERRRFAAGLKAIARSCGDARELDVFIDELLARATKRLGREPGLAAIRKAALAERQRAWARARRMIDSQRFAGTVLGVEGWIEGGGWRSAAGARASEPARDFARRALKRLHRKTLKSGADLENKDEPALHKLRLRAKRLRYAAEFFAPLFPKKLGRRYVEALADVQERLGALNDAVTVRHVLAVLARRPLGRGEAFERGAALMLGWSAAQVGTELERLPETWSAFADGKTFWK